MPKTPRPSSTWQSSKSFSQNVGPSVPPLQFVTATNPDQFREKSNMRKVRRGVMIGYLQRAEADPRCTDIRVSRARNKRAMPPRSMSSAEPETALPYASPIERTKESASESLQQDPPASVSIHDAQMLSGRRMSVPPQNVPVFFDPDIEDEAESYPRPRQFWHPFETGHIDVNALKQSCAQYFGTPAMDRTWAPLIQQAPEACLSILCISSPYLDLMQTPTPDASLGDSTQTLAVRHEVIRLIQRSMNDPDRRIHDVTIMTVLQLLTGDVISANTQTLHIHELGLSSMIKERGGLEQLGGNGQIASTVVVTCLDMAIWSNKAPDAMYHEFVQSCARSRAALSYLPASGTATPMEPVHISCLPFFDFALSDQCSPAALQIMSLVKSITDAVIGLYEARAGSTHGENALERAKVEHEDRLKSIIQMLAGQVYVLPYASQVGLSAPWVWAYESCRQVALIYATAIWRNVPFAEAAAHGSMSVPGHSGIDPAQVKAMISLTDLSTCWQGMTSVLYFITLVAGSACGEHRSSLPASRSSPTASSFYPETGFTSNTMTATASASLSPDLAEAILTRRWLLALGVRCSILLRFEHTNDVLCSLERLVTIQKILREGSDQSLSKTMEVRNDSVI